MLGILGSVYGVAFIIGPIIAGILLQVGWPWLFGINIPLAVLIAVLGYRKLPATRRPGAKQLDWTGIGVLAVMLGSLAYGINQVDTTAFIASVSSLAVWPFLLVALVLLPVFIWNERRAADPLLRLSLFQNRQVVLAALLAGGAGMTEAAFIFFPALAVAAFGVTKSTASFMLLPLVFAVAIGSPLAGRVLDRVGSRAIVLIGSTCLAIGLALVGLFPAEKMVFYGGSVFIGFGLAALLGSALSYILLNEARAEERTVAQGISTLAISIGQLMGGALIGAVAASGDEAVAGYAGAFLTISAIALVLTLLALGLKKRVVELAREH
jgi:MFS family permease